MPKRKTKEEFIEKAREIHSDKYDYSKVEYINTDTKVIIICKEHGHFTQTPASHINKKSGCRECSFIISANKNRSNNEEFIQKAKEIHGDKYDYSKVEYGNANKKIIITCKIHGDYQQRPASHINLKNGCRECSFIILANKNRSNNEEFIQKAKEIHGDKYDYSKVEYIDCRTNVVIICKDHGEFQQTPGSHISQKAGCHKCGCVYRYNTEEFIEKVKNIHGDKYDYKKLNYINAYTKITISCKTHGDFTQTPNDHLNNKAGCKYCYDYRGISQKSNTNGFIEKAKKIHIDKYDYSKVVYVNSHTDVIIICKIHGKYLQKAAYHLSGSGCSKCVNKTEGKLYEKLQPLYPSLIQQFKQDWCKNITHLPFDFCIPEHNIIIELDGRQHFEQISNWSSPEEQLENDKYKEKQANDNNYSVIRILQEDVFYDTYDWFKKLCSAIEDIINGDDIVNIYLCQNDEYKDFY